MPTTSWCCAKAAKKQRPPWCESAPGSRTTVFVCIRTKRLLATAANEEKGSSSSATGLKLEGVLFARRASTVSKIVSGPDQAHVRPKPRAHHRKPQPDATGMVQLLQTGASQHIPRRRSVHSTTVASDTAQAGEAARLRQSAQ